MEISDNPTLEYFPIFPGLTTLEILQKVQKDVNVRQLNPGQVEGRMVFMLMFNYIDRTKKGNYSECFFEFREGGLRKKASARTLVIPRSGRGMERTLINLKDSKIKSLMPWRKILKKVDIRYCEVSVR